MNATAPPTNLLRWAQWIILVIAIGAGAGRIFSAQKPDAKLPLFSANDRSRWATVLALVHQHTFIIDDVIENRGKRTKWHTIDLVQHRGRDGKQHYYSSKPPLLPVLVAVQYAAIAGTGVSLDEHTAYVIRLLLLSTNLLPYLIFLLVARHLADQLAETDASRLFVLAAAAWGTFLTTFLITLNNHLPAAFSIALASVFVWEILRRQDPPWWCFPPAGMFAAFAVTNELPALSFFALAGAALAWRSPSKTFLGFAPPALAVAVAFFGLNFVAHDHFIPPYAHRKDGEEIGRLDESLANPIREGRLASEVREPLALIVGEDPKDEASCFRASDSRWAVQFESSQRRWAIVKDELPGLAVKAWGNWYDYPSSYWMGEKRGVDRGEPKRAVYLFHVLLGHHGVFSLSPVWLLSLVGGAIMIRRGGVQRSVALGILLLTVVVLGFYVARPMIDRNYGGVSCTFRWALWLIPLWLVPLAPAGDWLLRRGWGRVLTAVLLAASVASAQYAAGNPFTQPWLFDYWTWLGWIHYT